MPARGQTRKGANKLIDQIVLKGPSQRPSLNRNEMLPATSGVPSGWDPLDRAIEVKLGEFDGQSRPGMEILTVELRQHAPREAALVMKALDARTA